MAAQAQDFWTGKIREFSFSEKVAPPTNLGRNRDEPALLDFRTQNGNDGLSQF